MACHRADVIFGHRPKSNIATRRLTVAAERVWIDGRMVRESVAEAPRRHERQTVSIELDRALVVRLRPEAARRGLPVTSLIRDLLDTIATDSLTTPILDDGDHDS